jgi:hypothetical protein
VGDYKPQVGDQVRVVVEGEVELVDGFGFTVGPQFPVIYEDDKDVLVSVEKIEPPVEVFGPGDVVRRLVDRDYVYALGDNGYTNLTLQHVYTYNDDLRSFNADDFTSKSFERVTLS